MYSPALRPLLTMVNLSAVGSAIGPGVCQTYLFFHIMSAIAGGDAKGLGFDE